MMWSVLPFRRRRSRWERLREAVVDRAELQRRLREAQRVRDVLPPVPGELRQRVQPLVERAAAARADLPVPETPAFLQEGLERLAALARHQRPTRRQNIMSAQAPVVLFLGVAAGAFVAGFLIGRATAGRRPDIAPEELEAAADKIKDTWPGIHDEDIREARGNLRRLSSVIEERTGEDEDEVRERLAGIISRAQSVNGGSRG
jgi:hypothetical protein